MSAEYTTFFRIPASEKDSIVNLAEEAEEALARASKAAPGDRTEVVRFEALCTAIEATAVRTSDGKSSIRSDGAVPIRGAPVLRAGPLVPDGLPDDVMRWLDANDAVVALHLPHTPGTTKRPGQAGAGPQLPAEAWEAKGGRRAAVVERFNDLLFKAVSSQSSDNGDSQIEAIKPSGVQNEVLTNGLRDSVTSDGHSGPIYVPVTYSDGSAGKDFPLRSLRLTADVNDSWRILRFALMSIRHVEMDIEVTGAWLRNMLISRHRPAGLTDQVAYEISVQQLARIAHDEPSVIYMHQTGFPPAVVGFYRAVVEHLIATPGTVAVIPHFYQGKAGLFAKGKPWAT